MAYGIDDVKKEQWRAELADHTELRSEQLLGLFPSNTIHDYDAHQRAKLGESLLALVENPLPAPADEEEIEEQKLLLNNVSTYDDVANSDEFWDLIYTDDVITQMTDQRHSGISDEAYAKALRVRVGVVAHYLLDVIYRSQNPAEDNGQGAAA